MNRFLVPTSALMWGLQIAFLSPSLALILSTLYGATTAEIGWVLAIYNVSGFIASLVVPAWADRHLDYLRPMLLSGALTLLLVLVLAVVTTLPLVTIVLVVVGGPAGVGISMLFAHLRHAGARPSQIVDTRAIVSVAWVAGPPMATLIIGWFGPRAILLAIGLVALANIATTMLMIRGHRAALSADDPSTPAPADEELPLGKIGVVLVTAAFVLLQATNATSMSFLAVYVPQTVGIDVVWAGIALGVAAGLEVPALMIVGRLTERYSSLGLIVTSCLAGIVYYLGVAAVTGPFLLIALQVLNAWCFAGIGGGGAHAVPADDPAARSVHRAVHEHPTRRRGPLRAADRARRCDRPRPARDLLRVRPAHPGGPADHRRGGPAQHLTRSRGVCRTGPVRTPLPSARQIVATDPASTR